MSELNPPVGYRKVLIVDDDEHTRQILRDACEASGFEVSMAPDGTNVEGKLTREQPDFLLLDLVMPEKDGFSVLKDIRTLSTWRDLPVILLSGIGSIHEKIRGMELGADDYITKPFNLNELQARINAALQVRDYRKRLHAAEAELSQVRALDPLTGAGTYSQLKASLDVEIARSRRYGTPVSVLFFSLYDFSALRSRLGRQKVDDVLRGLVSQVKNMLRGADKIFRLDTEEFIVLLPETDLKGAHVVALRVQERVQHVEVEYRGMRNPLAACIAGAGFPLSGVETGEDMLRHAYEQYQKLVEAGTPIFSLS